MKAVFASGLTRAVARSLSGCVTLTLEGRRNLCVTIEQALTVPEAELETSRAPRERLAAISGMRYGLTEPPDKSGTDNYRHLKALWKKATH